MRAELARADSERSMLGRFLLAVYATALNAPPSALTLGSGSARVLWLAAGALALVAKFFSTPARANGASSPAPSRAQSKIRSDPMCLLYRRVRTMNPAALHEASMSQAGTVTCGDCCRSVLGSSEDTHSTRVWEREPAARSSACWVRTYASLAHAARRPTTAPLTRHRTRRWLAIGVRVTADARLGAFINALRDLLRLRTRTLDPPRDSFGARPVPY
jgi:hypothetical protein